jgi:exonuclease III
LIYTECVREVEQSEKIVVLGDMNARVGDVEVAIVKFGVPGVNWAVEEWIMLYRGWSCGKHVVKEEASEWLRDNGADEALMDWVLIDKRLKGSLIDEDVLRSWGAVIGSDHFPVVAKMYWNRTRYERKEEQKIKVIRVYELLKKENAERYT